MIWFLTELTAHLSWHDLRVGPSDLHAGVETGAVVGLHDVATVHLVSSHATVVGALGAGEPVLGPAEGMLVLVEERVLLLDTEPRHFSLSLIHHDLTRLTVVGLWKGKKGIAMVIFIVIMSLSIQFWTRSLTRICHFFITNIFLFM